MSSRGQEIDKAAAIRVVVNGMEVTSGRTDTADPKRADAVAISETGQSLFEMEQVKANLQEYDGWGNFNIDFSLDDQTGSLVITIVDRDTGEVLRQIPADEILALRSHLQDVIEDATAESA